MSNALAVLEKMKTTKLDSLVTDITEVPLDGNLRKVISIMIEKGVHEILLPDKNRCGMITVADALRASAETKPETLVTHIPVLTLETSAGEAARLMTDYKIGALPVSDGRKIVGQVTNLNLLHLLKGNLPDRRISSIAKEIPVTLNAEDSAATARDLFSRKRINHIPVKQRDKLVGLVTSSQVLEVLPARERVGTKSIRSETNSGLNFPVKDIMDTDPLTSSPQDSAEESLTQMLDRDKSCVLVAQWDELQGIATRSDFIALLAEPEEKEEVPIYIVGLPDDPFDAEAAKQKFKRSINQLHKILPQILEARSVIKSTASTPSKERRRYEVRVHIKTPKNTYSYMANGWQLAEVYDTIIDRLKRILSQKERRRKQHVRERE